MRTLVTGATGFLGSHLTERLLAEGYEVHALVRPRSNLATLNYIAPAVTFHTIDALGDNLEEVLAQVRPEIVFHLATHFVVDHSPQDVISLINGNILFPTRLVDSMIRHGRRRLVNCSTAWQHYNNEAYNPVCLYAATKQAFLSLLKYYVEASQLRVADLEIPDTYGPNDRRPKLFSVLYRAAANTGPSGFSPGEQLLDLVYVDDVIDAIVAVGAQLFNAEAPELTHYAIHSQQVIRLKDLVATFSRITGLTPNIRWGARPYRDREMTTPWLGGQAPPGWKPRVGIEEGIRRVHASHVQHPEN